MRFIISLLFILFIQYGSAQERKISYNLDFEEIDNGIPVYWDGFYSDENYKIALDSTVVKSGKYSVAIESLGESPGSKYISNVIPNYNGKTISLSGYIKTQGITEGYAALWLEINHSNGFELIAFNDEMRIKGNTDWQKYEITLDMNPRNTKDIVFYGVLSGKGKIWIDDLRITIDGTDIEELKPYEKKPLPAENDKEFDTGSHIAIPTLNDNLICNLDLLGKIWGFLKYHHPAIANGNYNWDYQLFRFLPHYVKANTHTERNRLLCQWIDQLGNIPDSDNSPSSDNAFVKPDLSWILNPDIDSELRKKLQHIYINRFRGNHYYVMMSYFGNPLFLNENEYAQMPYPDSGFRLLALYRYWNMVHYFFPSKYLTDKDWNNILSEYIPIFIKAQNELEYEMAVIRLIGEINDSHAGYLLAGFDKLRYSRGYWISPVRSQFVGDQLVVSGYYSLKDTTLTTDELKKNLGIKAGDIITSINGKPVSSIVDSVRMYYPASNEPTQLKHIAMDLLNSTDKTICVDYVSSGNTKQKNIDLFRYNYLNLYEQDIEKYYKIPLNEGNIGYIKLETLSNEDIAIIKTEFQDTKGLIIDLRSRPTLAGRSLNSWFVSSKTPFMKSLKANPHNPGEFIFSGLEYIYPSKDRYTGKVVVLVNEHTLSEGEYQAMMFRAGHNTTIIGSQTAGADGRVSDIFLPGGIKTWFSGIGIYYPDGSETQRIGIIPDIEVKPTIEGLKNNRDELLEKAIDIIKME